MKPGAVERTWTGKSKAEDQLGVLYSSTYRTLGQTVPAAGRPGVFHGHIGKQGRGRKGSGW